MNMQVQIVLGLVLGGLIFSCSPEPERLEWSLVLHGGAGTIREAEMTPEQAQLITADIDQALAAGGQVLASGGRALDAVEVCIRILEDSPRFNAGKGAVFTHEGRNELDASIMDGRTLQAGAVAGVRGIANPISLARLVMDSSAHVMLTGEGAVAFAGEMGIPSEPDEYFWTEQRWEQLQRSLAADKHGTVGVVAMDHSGDLAAGTSTGGMTNKRFGRVGDSPIIGAGTYANNATCGVSATGHGEYFMRLMIAHDISAQMEYAGVSLQQAVKHTIQDKLTGLGGTGGVIALDRFGRRVIQFNTPGMYRGWLDAGGDRGVVFYGAGAGDVSE